MKLGKNLLMAVGLFMATSLGAVHAQDAATDAQIERLKSQAKLSLELLNDPELIQLNAQYYKQLYDALIKEGFSKDQALKILVAVSSGKG